MKDNFRGWKSVYAFTFRQYTKTASFKAITLLVALLMFGAFIVTNVMVAKSEMDKKDEMSPIKNVYVLDNSGLQPTNYKEIISQLDKKQFQRIEFVNAGSRSSDNVIRTAAADSPETLAVIITLVDSSYELKAVIPENSKITRKQAEALLEPVASAFRYNKMMQAGLSTEQLMSAINPAVASFSNIGENTSETAKIIKLVAPMLFSSILYFLILLYGQNISKSVSMEKTSKLVEVLLTSVHPYSLITGKVLAVTSIGILQFTAWLAAATAGLYGGNAVAHAIYPSYHNTAVTIINYVRDNIGETALTPPALILSIIIFCVGFLFYCVIAAAAGCMVSKPEDVASTQAVFQTPVVASWLACYFAPLIGKDGFLTAVRYIPFTAPFSVPVDLITGAIGLWQGLLSLALLLMFSLFIIILSGRIYKGLVLYTGQKLSIRMIGNVLKANR